MVEVSTAGSAAVATATRRVIGRVGKEDGRLGQRINGDREVVLDLDSGSGVMKAGDIVMKVMVMVMVTMDGDRDGCEERRKCNEGGRWAQIGWRV